MPNPNYDPNLTDSEEFLFLKFNDPILSTIGIDGQAVLDEYRDRAINILEHLKKEGKQDFRPAPTMMITYGHYRYKELIGFLSAYELLRMSTTLDDRNKDLWRLKNSKLALQGTVRNLYQKTGVFIEGASNNHTLQYAGAMGLAAIVLHDCGSGRWKKTWHPSKWAGKANWHIENTLFENNDRQRMTEEDEIAGYAEGPHYFAYGFESLAPFLTAFRNFVPADHTEQADAGVWRGKLTVDNHDTKEKFHNLYKWYNEIQMPEGQAPTYDNTYVGTKLYPYFLKTLNKGANFNHDVGSYGVVGAQYHPDVIASENVKKFVPAPKVTLLPKSGNLILQSDQLKYPKLEDRMYFMLLNENGTSVNGGNHEHADRLTFQLKAGNELLAIDPPYVGYDNREFIEKGCDHNSLAVNWNFGVNWNLGQQKFNKIRDEGSFGEIEKLLELLAPSHSQKATNSVSESLKRIYASLNLPKITLHKKALELFDFLLFTTFTKNTRPTAGF